MHTSVFELAQLDDAVFLVYSWEKLFKLLQDAWWKWLIDRVVKAVNVNIEDDENASEAEKKRKLKFKMGSK